MARINNTSRYELDDPVSVSDFVVGSEAATGVTKNYQLNKIFELFESLLGMLDIQYDDVEDSVSLYDYHGGVNSDGNWVINRYLKTDVLQKTKAVFGNNQSYFDIDSAWPERATLVYV